MDTTTNLALPLLAAAQAQKHVTHNEALLVVDALLQAAVRDKDLAAPPADPDEGDRYLVATAASGAWSGKTGRLAAWRDGGWRFFDAKAGFVVFVLDESLLYVFDGTAWTPLPVGLTAVNDATLIGLGTHADAAHPFAAKLNVALWTARAVGEGGTGDLRVFLNKESAANTLSLLFQTAYSGRAELGLVGDDSLAIRTSPNGVAWKNAVRIDNATGGIDFLVKQATLASAALCDLGASGALKVRIDGTTTITSFGLAPNTLRFLLFGGSLTLTHDATTLVLPGGANIVTAPGDCAVATSDASGNWRVTSYERASGQALTPTVYPAPKTVVIFGSSNGAGMGASTFTADPSADNGWASPATSWAGLLRSALQAIDPAWTVINRSISGTGSANGVSRFWTDVAPHRPSHVILCHSPHNDGYSAQTHLQNTEKLCQMCDAIGAVPILRGATPYNAMTSGQYRAMLDVNRQLDLLGRHRIDHLTTLDNGSGGFVGGSSYHVDGLHPSDAGYAVLFSAIDLGIFIRGTAYARRDASVRGAWKVQDGQSTQTGIIVSAATGLLGGGLRSFTMRSRIKGVASGGLSARGFMAAHLQGAVGAASPLRLRNPSGAYDVADGGSFTITGVATNPTADANPHDIVLTYNHASNTCVLYIDGVSVGTPSGTISGAGACSTFSFGSRGETSNAAPAAGYSFSDIGLWAVPLGPAAVADMVRSGRKPPASLLVDAVMSGSPASGGLLPNAVGTGIFPALGDAVWESVTPY